MLRTIARLLSPSARRRAARIREARQIERRSQPINRELCQWDVDYAGIQWRNSVNRKGSPASGSRSSSPLPVGGRGTRSRKELA